MKCRASSIKHSVLLFQSYGETFSAIFMVNENISPSKEEKVHESFIVRVQVGHIGKHCLTSYYLMTKARQKELQSTSGPVTYD